MIDVLEPVPKKIEGNFGVNTKELERVTPVSKELLQFFTENDIPISFEISGILSRATQRNNDRYGTEYAIASGKLMRTLVRHPEEKLQLFGLSDPNELADLIEQEMITDEDTKGLTFEQRSNLLRLEIAEVADNPLAHYPNIAIMKKLSGTKSQSARLFIDLLSQAAAPEKKTGYIFPVDKSSTRYLICKDSEFYFCKRLDPTYETNYDARSTIFHDNQGTPVFLQKTGGYKVDNERDGLQITTNATAINLITITVNGINLPPGTLVGLKTNLDKTDEGSYVRNLKNQVFGIDTIEAVMPLRLTIFAVDETAREFAFGKQYTELAKSIGKVPTLSDFIEKAKKVIEDTRN